MLVDDISPVVTGNSVERLSPTNINENIDIRVYPTITLIGIAVLHGAGDRIRTC